MYEGRLECGSERTASALLQLPSRAQVEKELDLYVCQPLYSAWVQAALEPNSPVCFLDTSEVSLTFFIFLSSVHATTKQHVQQCNKVEK